MQVLTFGRNRQKGKINLEGLCNCGSSLAGTKHEKGCTFKKMQPKILGTLISIHTSIL